MSHAWIPVEGETGQYRCSACGSTGYRASSGEIREHKQRKAARRKWTTKSADRVPRIGNDWDPGRNDQ